MTSAAMRKNTRPPSGRSARCANEAGPTRAAGGEAKSGAEDQDNAAPADAEARRRPMANRSRRTGWFTAFAQKAAQTAGRPSAFILAFVLVAVWCVSGPIFGFSDSWQLVINTGTTIVTFLMVFLIQHTQNRDSIAFQVKLDELIIALRGARDGVAGAEDLCDEDLQALHETYRKRAAETLDCLQARRKGKPAEDKEP